jgi:hypothetical protein
MLPCHGHGSASHFPLASLRFFYKTVIQLQVQRTW